MKSRVLVIVAAVMLALFAAPAFADGLDTSTSNIPPDAFDVGVDEHLDGQVPLDAIFKDETGKMVRFGDFVDGKRPVLLVLAYHSCKTLCSFVQHSVLDALKGTTWSVGKEFDVVTMSIDSRDTPAIARGKKEETLAEYARGGADKGWHFITGDDQNAHRVADAVGWKFHKDIDGEIAHPAAVVLLKPNGRVARYLYGIELPASDMSLGLIEASEGKNITTFDRIKLYCYHYDPHGRKYALFATHLMEIGGGLTLLLVTVFIGGMWLKERRKQKTPENGAPARQAANPA